MTAMFVWTIVPRGLRIGYFTDHLKTRCSVQKSSITEESCVWLGVDERGARMNLNQEMAAELIAVLSHFVQTGDLPQLGERQPQRRDNDWQPYPSGTFTAI
jgi:hypothetical protein